MQMINGTAKPKIMFEKIPEIFQYDLDYRLYIAEYDSKVVAALLIFFFKDQVEYFLPVIHKDFRSYQPLSALIYTAMADSIKDKESKVWNWGGTWATQDTLYRFKKSWNAHDKEYRYHIKTNLSSTVLRGINFKEAILEFQNFYLYPVSEEYYD
jgi:lipid II:glycine glycyltransferase (peptidoglycan interpeptide bridge formation enzyme)